MLSKSIHHTQTSPGMGDGRKPVAVCGFLRQPSGLILYVRSAKDVLAGKWSLCHGLQNQGQTLEEAMMRVARTQVGLTDTITAPQVSLSHLQEVFNPAEKSEDGDLPVGYFDLYTFIVQVPQTFTPCLGLPWVQADWFPDYCPAPTDDPFAKTLVLAIHGGKLARANNP